MSNPKKPLALIIIDGFGSSASDKYNAIEATNAPTWKSIWNTAPSTLVATSGMAVGLPDGQMGNSEVGHMTLGAGRVVYQNYTRINKAISDGDFFTNPAYTKAVDAAKDAGKAVHVIGLLSDGGVHSHEDHLIAMMKLAVERGAKEVYLHAMLDGRDTPPRSAHSALEKAEKALKAIEGGKIASVIGRFYALDRDNRWDRVQQAYDLITQGKSEFTYTTAKDALEAAYERDENDEFVQASAIINSDGSKVEVNDGDAVIFMNFRPDRARQLTNAFVEKEFDGFERSKAPALCDFVMTTEYAANIPASCAYPPEDLVNSFGDVVSKAGKKQLRIAETEKYAHVTFFFSGGQEELYDGEDRILIPSPDVTTYDQKPEMSAIEVTDKLVDAIKKGGFDAIICNYANCDQVGHTGNFDASVKAVEAVDMCLARVLDALKEVGGEALITADHGNVEQMFDDESNQPHTQHTTFPVPLVYVGERDLTLENDGSLADIAPTMLALMDIAQPTEMNGKNLAKLK